MRLDNRDSDSPARVAPRIDAHPTTSLWTGAFVVVVVLQFALVTVNGSSSMAIPAVKTGLNADNSSIQWFAALFPLGFAPVLVLSGRLGDLFGTKRLLLVGYGGLVASAILAAFAPSIWFLLAARLIQGIAGGITAPQLSAMIQRTFGGHTRTRAFAVFLTFSGGAFMIGQLSGGALIAADPFGFGWRWAFIPFIPMGFITWVLAARVLPRTPPGTTGRLDLLGAAVLSVVALLVMFPLIQGRNSQWAPWIFVILVCSIPAFILFVRYERSLVGRGGDPLVDPSLFTIPSFRIGNVITLLVGLLSAAAPVYLILTIQLGFGRDPLQAAILTCPMPFANMFGSMAAASLLRRFGRSTIAMGAAFNALSAVLILVAISVGGESLAAVHLVPGIALLGFALGISIASSMAIVLADVPPENAGSASGVQSTGLQLAGAIGIAVYGIGFYGAIGETTSLAVYLDGIATVMWLTIALTVVQFGLTVLLPRHRARR